MKNKFYSLQRSTVLLMIFFIIAVSVVHPILGIKVPGKSKMISFDEKPENFYPIVKNEYYDYVIITSKELEQSAEFFKNWKNIIGFSVKIINVSYIDSSFSGRDTAEKIKNFLKEKFDDWAIEYVLFVGDGDIVPWRYCYKPSSEKFAIPSDYYYADLTSNWDSDGDGLFGEINQDQWPSFTPDVYVGRIPINNPEELQKIFQKIIDFEQDQNNWKYKALLLGAITNLENEIGQGNPKTDSAALMEFIKTDFIDTSSKFSCTTMYETEGLAPSIYESDMPLTEENVINEWNKGYGLVSWGSHGTSTQSLRRFWIEDKNANNVPDFDEIGNESFISRYNAYSLNDEFSSLVVSCSCHNADPKNYDNLGYTLIKNGAIGFIGATHYLYYIYGWEDKNDGGSMTITYHFFKNFLKLNQSFGESFYKAMHHCWSNDEITILDANIYIYSLYGDPSISLCSYPGLETPSNPIKPEGNQILNPDVTYQFSTSLSADDMEKIYYIWDWGDGTMSKPFGPYSGKEKITVSHKWEMPGKYRVKVKSLSMTGDESDWSEPLLLHITGPVIKIEEISGGLLKINAIIKNIGDKKAENINWKITLEGGSIIIGKQSSGLITSLDPNQKSTIISKTIYGIGFPSVITVEAGIPNETSDVEVQSANIIFSVIQIN